LIGSEQYRRPPDAVCHDFSSSGEGDRICPVALGACGSLTVYSCRLGSDSERVALIGRFYFDEPSKHVVSLPGADHIERGHIAKDILRFLKKVGWTVKQWNMPPQPIAQFSQSRY
jgi:hypothetical protein